MGRASDRNSDCCRFDSCSKPAFHAVLFHGDPWGGLRIARRIERIGRDIGFGRLAVVSAPISTALKAP